MPRKSPLLHVLLTLGVILFAMADGACLCASQTGHASDESTMADPTKPAPETAAISPGARPAASGASQSDPKPDRLLIFAALGTAVIIALFAYPRREK